jgi:uncharacterized DUF497 family protein
VRFDWDPGNLSHIESHEVTAAEVEEALNGLLLYDPLYERDGEQRASVYGRTTAARILKIVFTIRGERLRVVTAHTAKKRERKRYEQYEKSQGTQASAALE